MRSGVLLILVILVLTALTPLSAYPARPSATVGFLGYKGYSMFTRLVFDTGTTHPESFKIGYDEVGRKVVFTPLEGGLKFTFKPVSGLDSTVSDVDYIEVEQGKLGVVVRLGRKAVGLRVSYLHVPNRLVLDIYRQTPVKPFMQVNREVKTVAIDPGHGGVSLGFVGREALSEADVVYKLAQKLKERLVSSGYDVVLTRDADKEPGPDERAGVANTEGADIFISLHATGRPVRGAATILTCGAGRLDGSSGEAVPFQWSEQQAVYLPESLTLARKVSTALKALGGEPFVRDARVSGFEGLSMPAVMVEFGGLTGDGREPALADEGYQDRIASYLTDAVKSYSGGL